MLCGIASGLPFWFNGLGAGVERQVSPLFLNVSLVSAFLSQQQEGRTRVKLQSIKISHS